MTTTTKMMMMTMDLLPLDRGEEYDTNWISQSLKTCIKCELVFWCKHLFSDFWFCWIATASHGRFGLERSMYVHSLLERKGYYFFHNLNIMRHKSLFPCTGRGWVFRFIFCQGCKSSATSLCHNLNQEPPSLQVIYQSCIPFSVNGKYVMFSYTKNVEKL